MIFVIFDEFSKLLHRGSVTTYEHIYFLDRSRCDLLESLRIWLGLKGFGVDRSEIRLQAQGGLAGENSFFRSESPKPIETYRKKTGTYPNRPWRTRWNRNFRNLFVLCRASIENRGICGGATFRTYLRRRRPGRSAL